MFVFLHSFLRCSFIQSKASISTHIAAGYYYADTKTWSTNLPLYIKAVGAHPVYCDVLSRYDKSNLVRNMQE